MLFMLSCRDMLNTFRHPHLNLQHSNFLFIIKTNQPFTAYCSGNKEHRSTLQVLTSSIWHIFRTVFCGLTQMPFLKCDQYSTNQYKQHIIAPCCLPSAPPNHARPMHSQNPINLAAVTGTHGAVVLGVRSQADHYDQPSTSWVLRCVTFTRQRFYYLSQDLRSFGL